MYHNMFATAGGAVGGTAGNRLALFGRGVGEEVKSVVSQPIEEIGFAPVYTDFLREDGRKQQTGMSIYNPVTVEEDRETLVEIS